MHQQAHIDVQPDTHAHTRTHTHAHKQAHIYTLALVTLNKIFIC